MVVQCSAAAAAAAAAASAMALLWRISRRRGDGCVAAAVVVEVGGLAAKQRSQQDSEGRGTPQASACLLRPLCRRNAAICFISRPSSSTMAPKGQSEAGAPAHARGTSWKADS